MSVGSRAWGNRPTRCFVFHHVSEYHVRPSHVPVARNIPLFPPPVLSPLSKNPLLLFYTDATRSKHRQDAFRTRRYVQAPPRGVLCHSARRPRRTNGVQRQKQGWQENAPAGTNPIHNKKPKKKAQELDEDDLAYKAKLAAGTFGLACLHRGHGNWRGIQTRRHKRSLPRP